MELLLGLCGVVGAFIAMHHFIAWSERRDAKAAVREIQALMKMGRSAPPTKTSETNRDQNAGADTAQSKSNYRDPESE